MMPELLLMSLGSSETSKHLQADDGTLEIMDLIHVSFFGQGKIPWWKLAKWLEGPSYFLQDGLIRSLCCCHPLRFTQQHCGTCHQLSDTRRAWFIFFLWFPRLFPLKTWTQVNIKDSNSRKQFPAQIDVQTHERGGKKKNLLNQSGVLPRITWRLFVGADGDCKSW